MEPSNDEKIMIVDSAKVAHKTYKDREARFNQALSDSKNFSHSKLTPIRLVPCRVVIFDGFNSDGEVSTEQR